MNKKIKRSAVSEFYYMPSDTQSRHQYDVLTSIDHPLKKLQFISKKLPAIGCFGNDSKNITYRPMLGNVYVSMSTEFRNYPTPGGAYTQACRIKSAIEKRIMELSKSYQNRDMNLRIIREHFPLRRLAV